MAQYKIIIIMSNIIGREREQDILKSSMHSKKSEFIVLYGRHRVGKTFLIKEFYNGIFDFSFVGTRSLNRQQPLAY